MKNIKKFSYWQLINMNIGFLGIQFAWALQMANLSGMYSFLGAKEYDLAFLWLAAPMTGLIFQPLVGLISDYTWFGFFGRRRFYIFIGSIMASIALFLLPNSHSVFIACSLIWLLDSGLNIAMQPFRAYIADVTPIEQHNTGYSILTALIGIGACLAFYAPNVINYVFDIEHVNQLKSEIPLAIKYSFYIGGVVILVTNCWTVFSTRESYELPLHKKQTRNNLLYKTFFDLPPTMKDLIATQFFTWIGMFSFFVFYSIVLAQNIYGLPAGVDIDGNLSYKILLEKGVLLSGFNSAIYTLSSVLFSIILPVLCRRYTRKFIHVVGLVLGGVGLIIATMAHSYEMQYFSMLLFGFCWAVVITLPFSILSACLPSNKIGWFIGLFNVFVVLPEILLSLFSGIVVRTVFDNNVVPMFFVGGVSLIIGGFFANRVREV